MNFNKIAASDDGSYKLTVTAVVSQDGITCQDSKDAPTTIKVTTPADLSNLSVIGAGDYCLSDGDQTLSVTGVTNVPSDATANTVTYQWKKDGTDIPGATSATHKVTAALASNGSYSCDVSVAATATNPCTASGTASSATLTYKMCGKEPLTPGTDPNEQNGEIAILCNKETTIPRPR